MSYVASGTQRETIYNALQALLQQNLVWQSSPIPVVRGWPPSGSPDAAVSPVAYMFQAGGKTTTRVSLPPVYTDKVMLVVKVLQQDSTSTPSTALNQLRDLVDSALKADNPAERVCTLGGLVRYCWVTGDWYVEGTGGSWTDFRSTIEFQYFSANNQ